MGFSYSLDLRKRVVASILGGMSHRKAGEIFDIAPSTAGNWCRLCRDKGSFEPAKRQPRSSGLDKYKDYITTLIEQNVDITLREIAESLLAEHGFKCALSTIHYFLVKQSITYKKKQLMPVNSTGKMYLSAE